MRLGLRAALQCYTALNTGSCVALVSLFCGRFALAVDVSLPIIEAALGLLSISSHLAVASLCCEGSVRVLVLADN